VPLAAGLQALRLAFYNGPCCDSVLVLDTGGVALVPEVDPRLMMAAGLLGIGWLVRRRLSRS